MQKILKKIPQVPAYGFRDAKKKKFACILRSERDCRNSHAGGEEEKELQYKPEGFIAT
jgi:hypothetical protein